MTLAQSLTAVIVFWAIIGGLGASLLLPAMQSLIHGNFEGAAQKRAYALVGASAAIAAAVGPLLGGFVTTYLSWRVGFLLEAVVIAVVLSGLKEVRDAVVHRTPPGRPRRRAASPSSAWVASSWGSSCGRRAVRPSARSWRSARSGSSGLAQWLVRRHRDGKPALLDPDLFRVPNFRIGITQQMLQQITLGGAMIALPIFLQMTLEYDAMQAGLSIAPLSLSMFGVALLAGRRAGTRRPSTIVQWGFALCLIGMVAIIPIVPRADSGWALVIPLVVAGSGLGLLVSQLNNYTLAPISEERISEAAGVNSAAGSFGLSFGLAMGGGLMLATLSLAFTNMTEASDVIPPAQQQAIAEVLEDDAEVMSNAALDELLPEEPEAVQDEILRINADARDLALQVALLVPEPRLRDRPVQRAPHGPPPRHRPVGIPRRRRPRLIQSLPRLVTVRPVSHPVRIVAGTASCASREGAPATDDDNGGHDGTVERWEQLRLFPEARKVCSAVRRGEATC